MGTKSFRELRRGVSFNFKKKKIVFGKSSNVELAKINFF